MPADRFLIERLLYGFSYENVAAVYARQLPAADCQFIERYTREFNYPKTSRLKSKEDLSNWESKPISALMSVQHTKRMYTKAWRICTKTIFQ